jgi:hypothetical protein
MLNHADSIARKLEALPICRANRSIAQAHFEAAEARIDGIVRALAWMSSVGLRRRVRARFGRAGAILNVG